MDPLPIPLLRVVALVFVGGGVGSVLRFAVSEGVHRTLATPTIPWGTLTVNVLGSLVLGWFLARTTGVGSDATRAFVAVGVLGGFTTFSAFSGEVLAFLYSSQYARAFAYAAMSVTLAVAAALLGFTLARLAA
jgi:CrcB protein